MIGPTLMDKMLGPTNNHAARCALLSFAALMLAGCASLAPPPQTPAPAPLALDRSAWAASSATAAVSPSGWKHYTLPGKAATQFSYARKDGRDALAVKAVSSASMLRHKVRVEPAELGNVRFSWKVPQLIAEADMASRDADDSPVRVILAFEGDRSRFSARNSMMSELALALTGEEMPFATLMYVWCNKRAPGTVINNARTDRVRKIVVESGARKLDQWLDYERDIRADYQRAFGEAPGALVGIAIMTDSDNTRTTANAWYGPVQLSPSASVQ
jgi:hypothetical protein